MESRYSNRGNSGKGGGHREPLAHPLSAWRIIFWLIPYLHLESLVLLDEYKTYKSYMSIGHILIYVW